MSGEGRSEMGQYIAIYCDKNRKQVQRRRHAGRYQQVLHTCIQRMRSYGFFYLTLTPDRYKGHIVLMTYKQAIAKYIVEAGLIKLQKINDESKYTDLTVFYLDKNGTRHESN